MSLGPSQFTFTDDRLLKIWRDFENHKRGSTYEHHKLVNHDSSHGFPRASDARQLCLGFYDDVKDPRSHLESLDARYSSIYLPRLPRLGDRAPSQEFADHDTAKVLEKARGILGQLPATSPSILGALPLAHLPENGYLMADTGNVEKHDSTPDLVWDKLLVVNFVDTIVIRMVLQIAQSEFSSEFRPPMLIRNLNATIFLLRTSLDLATAQRREGGNWVIICAFLWTSWQRMLMLELRHYIGRQLEGFTEIGLESIRALAVVPEVFECRRQVQQRKLRETPYLCSWAYRNLVNDRGCISTDLRRFHEVYDTCFGTKPAVCNPGSSQCNGNSSITCGRFEQTVVSNQSSHTQRCEGNCARLFWVRDSFISVPGPKAVDIGATDATGIRYCLSTEKTLTISHVWSHGQGGRPDHTGVEGTGFNTCLHRRYSEIALLLGCSSYWMDTPCIPSEKDLRWDCIANITKIFSTSEITLICDRDIMTIDITDDRIESYEQLLSTLLVCDWNMRAWTLLESMRGRHSLYLLCLDDKIISVQEALRAVYLHGRIDVAAPFVTRSYLLPPQKIEHTGLFEGADSVYTDKDIERSKFISINEAAVLLSYRHATRDDDDLLIWNLLIGDTEEHDPVEMWKSRVGERLPTGSLISSAPRLIGIPGFHWAPCRPTLPRRTSTDTSNREMYPAFDGVDTKYGEITKDGFRAKWQIFKFPVPVFTNGEVSDLSQPQQSDDPCDQSLVEIANQYLDGYPKGILLQPMHARGPWYTPMPYPGSSDHILAVCGSQDGSGWEWRGVYKWERIYPLPKFDREEILLI